MTDRPSGAGAGGDRGLPTVYLYADPACPSLDAGAVGDYLETTAGVVPRRRGEFLTTMAPGARRPGLAGELARLRVRNPARPHDPAEPLLGEVAFEERCLADPAHLVPGVLYDGFGFMELLRTLLFPGERGLGHLHLVLTHRLLGTFDGVDRRYHARTVILGYPSVISTSGLVEAPAKPREFYLRRRAAATLGQGLPTEALKRGLGGAFLDYGDPRVTEVAKGYALQALVYHVAGEAFCGDPECRLYNAHWQAEMLHAQAEVGSLCPAHRSLVAAWRSSPRPSEI